MPQSPLQSEKVQFHFAVWHLYRGGITDAAAIARILGKPLHANSLESIVEDAERLLRGPYPLPKPIRCTKCGGKITQLPCGLCGVAGESYREIR